MATALDKRQSLRVSAKRLASAGPIGIIGAGKVGTALGALLHARGAEVAAVSGRTPMSGRRMAREGGLPHETASTRQETIARSSIVFLAVPDDAIAPLCDDIARNEGWRAGQGVVHCSGALPASVLGSAAEAGALVASFHPLQAFASTHSAIEQMPGSAFALEGDAPLVERLQVLVEALGGTPLLLTAEEKTLYHVAAVIASNYTVTLAAVASKLLVRQGIAPDENEALRYLMPLIRGTTANLENVGLPNALTGPIARGDAGTIERHIEALRVGAPDLLPFYRELARLTLPIAEEKGQFSKEDTVTLKEIIEGKK